MPYLWQRAAERMAQKTAKEEKMLRIIVDPAPVLTPYHVQTARGVTLASFKTRQMAESYRKSKLLEIALDLKPEDRRAATEEETLP